MRYLILLILCLKSLTGLAQAQVPEATELYVYLEKVTPGEGTQPPSDAMVLFDGTDLSQWLNHQGRPAEWNVVDGTMEVNAGKGDIQTKQAFGDIQLHLEWMSPVMTGKEGQGYSNSGVFFMGMYEVQVLNSYENETYQNGQAGSVYKQYIPLVNASKPPGEWQEYDIIFNAPRFSDKGTIISPARLTVFHNGVLIQNNVALMGPTKYIGSSNYSPHASKLPLKLQDHGDPVRFRNIWVREL